jgi:hypothetical protein
MLVLVETDRVFQSSQNRNKNSTVQYLTTGIKFWNRDRDWSTRNGFGRLTFWVEPLDGGMFGNCVILRGSCKATN